jgi:hypothetical protein
METQVGVDIESVEDRISGKMEKQVGVDIESVEDRISGRMEKQVGVEIKSIINTLLRPILLVSLVYRGDIDDADSV